MFYDCFKTNKNNMLRGLGFLFLLLLCLLMLLLLLFAMSCRWSDACSFGDKVMRLGVVEQHAIACLDIVDGVACLRKAKTTTTPTTKQINNNTQHDIITNTLRQST